MPYIKNFNPFIVEYVKPKPIKTPNPHLIATDMVHGEKDSKQKTYKQSQVFKYDYKDAERNKYAPWGRSNASIN